MPFTRTGVQGYVEGRRNTDHGHGHRQTVGKNGNISNCVMAAKDRSRCTGIVCITMVADDDQRRSPEEI